MKANIITYAELKTILRFGYLPAEDIPHGTDPVVFEVVNICILYQTVLMASANADWQV